MKTWELVSPTNTQARLVYLLIMLLIGLIGTNAQVKSDNKNYNMTSFTEKGVPVAKENFTGTVWVNMNVKPNESYNVNIGTVTFEKNARTIAKQKEIVGSRIDDMYKNSPKDLLHIQEYLSANCFGDYITRNGLDIKTREMVTLFFLIALGGTKSQIKGHIQGNANVGNDRQTIINLMT